jgi:RNA polymerase sigma-70 factor (ECF subfamily)
MAIGQFRQDAKFSTWFYRIVVNRALTKIKKTLVLTADTEVNELEDMASEDMESIYKRLGAAEQKKIIDSALQELVMEDRLLLTLYYLQEQSVEEIARVTGLVKENIKMRLHRARKKLYLVLQQQLKSEINCVL